MTPGIQHPARRTPALQEAGSETQYVIRVFKVIGYRSCFALHKICGREVGFFSAGDSHVIGGTDRFHKALYHNRHCGLSGIPVNSHNGIRFHSISKTGYPLGKNMKSLLPTRFLEFTRPPRSDPFHWAGKTVLFVVKELQTAHAYRAYTPLVYRIIGAGFNFHGPVIDLSHVNTAASRA